MLTANAHLQLDASLVDLAPSAYDIVASSLPPPNPVSHGWQASGSEKLAQLPSPSTAKAAWRNSVQGSPSSVTATQRKQPPRGPVHPNESFVLLQDSVIRTIPSNFSTTATSQPKKPSFSKSRSATAAVPPAPAPEEPPHPNPSPLSHHLRSSLRLFNLLSSRTDLDHPLCAECTHILLGTLTRQLEETKKERDGYIAFEKEVRKEKEREASAGGSKPEAEAKIERLKDEERLAIEQLRAAERERQQFEEELKSLEREEKALEEEEAECVRRLAWFAVALTCVCLTGSGASTTRTCSSLRSRRRSSQHCVRRMPQTPPFSISWRRQTFTTMRSASATTAFSAQSTDYASDVSQASR